MYEKKCRIKNPFKIYCLTFRYEIKVSRYKCIANSDFVLQSGSVTKLVETHFGLRSSFPGSNHVRVYIYIYMYCLNRPGKDESIKSGGFVTSSLLM